MTALKDLEQEMRDIPYPGVGDREAKKGYQTKQHEILVRWKIQCLADNGLAHHPKADAIMTLAWEEGHSSGLYEVGGWVTVLAELVKDIHPHQFTTEGVCQYCGITVKEASGD